MRQKEKLVLKTNIDKKTVKIQGRVRTHSIILTNSQEVWREVSQKSGFLMLRSGGQRGKMVPHKCVLHTALAWSQQLLLDTRHFNHSFIPQWFIEHIFHVRQCNRAFVYNGGYQENDSQSSFKNILETVNITGVGLIQPPKPEWI